MCRWFAYISPLEHCMLDDVLIKPPHSLSKQCNSRYLPGLWPWETPDTSDDTPEGLQQVLDRNWYYNNDGLGVAWYTDVKSRFGLDKEKSLWPAVYRTLQHPSNDLSFASVCQNTSTLALLAHIRAASPGLPVIDTNCHPFTFGRWTFMHNGQIGSFHEIKRQLITKIGDAEHSNILGTGDSEHLAALFFTILARDTGDKQWIAKHNLTELKKAMEETLTTVLSITKAPSALNLAVTDGHVLLCTRFRDHKTEQPPSLYVSESAGVELNSKFGEDGLPEEEHGKHVIVASEPTTYAKDVWTLVPKNHAVLVDEKGGMRMEALQVSF